MLKKTVEFTGLTIDVQELTHQSRKIDGPVPSGWSRVKIKLPDIHHSSKIIEQWIVDNLKGRWWSSVYNERAFNKKSGGAVMVVKFEDTDDAILFKLQGGNSAHETDR